MITPRITRLVRVPDMRAMHAAIASLMPSSVADGSPRDAAVIVPTRGAAEELRRTLENHLLTASAQAIVLPDIVTRAELYARLHQRLPDPPPLLTAFDREVVLRRAARDAAGGGAEPPFHLRPGLIVQVLAFYDELRRNHRTLDDFSRLVAGHLEPNADIDRGAERMLRLTHFLAAALSAFERRIADSGCLDEHGLRTLLLDRGCVPPLRHVIVTVADQAADARGLWPADFDLLARLPELGRVDVIASESLLAAGFHQRIHALLPGLEEAHHGAASPLPVLAVPEPSSGSGGVSWFVCRDREEELVAVARMARASDMSTALAVVFQRPLPYLYLAHQVFADAQVPYHALDSLPLAAEPFVSALDLLFTFGIGEATRTSTIALLRSPHWSFDTGEWRAEAGAIAAADELLLDMKYVGGFDRLSSLAAEAVGARPRGERTRRSSLWTRAAPALRAAAAAAEDLRPVIDAPAASLQIDTLLAIIRTRERLPSPDDSWYSRHMRARAAVLGALQGLRDAHARYDDTALSLAELAAAVRRWIEGQTFTPRTGETGVRLLDAAAAPFADVGEVRLVGLVESDWPERSRRSIFYPASLLSQLGWAAEKDRLAAARARFQDLLTLPRTRVSLSAFTLEDDAIVPMSALLEDVEAAGLPIQPLTPPRSGRVFAHEAIAEEPVVADALAGSAADWLAVRMGRVAETGTLNVFGAAPAKTPTVYAVSHVERYLECPFKYFAAHVLRLPEERDDESGLSPQERGQFLHEVFHAFFTEWHASGRRAITLGTLEAALALFERVAEERLLTLAEADRALERTYLLGSAAAPGLAERAFAFEIEQRTEVLERLLEYELEGEFQFQIGGTTRTVALRAKADRIDLLDDGTLRVVDYKLGKAPKMGRALQLPIYGICAEQRLQGRLGRDWTLSRAGYVAFKEKHAFVPFGGPRPLAEALAAGQARFLEAIDGIESARFPADPDEPYRCRWCAYPTVCRKDYVGDE